MLCFVGCPSVILPWLFFTYIYTFIYLFYFFYCLSVFSRKDKTMFSSNKFPSDLFFFVLFSLLTDMKHVLYNKDAFDLYIYI